MKNRLCSELTVLCMSVIIFGCAEQTKEPEEPVRDPVPLVIESPDWTPHGAFGIAETGYEGVMYIEMDGKYIRISCTGAVRSRYGELF